MARLQTNPKLINQLDQAYKDVRTKMDPAELDDEDILNLALDFKRRNALTIGSSTSSRRPEMVSASSRGSFLRGATRGRRKQGCTLLIEIPTHALDNLFKVSVRLPQTMKQLALSFKPLNCGRGAKLRMYVVVVVVAPHF